MVPSEVLSEVSTEGKNRIVACSLNFLKFSSYCTVPMFYFRGRNFFKLLDLLLFFPDFFFLSLVVAKSFRKFRNGVMTPKKVQKKFSESSEQSSETSEGPLYQTTKTSEGSTYHFLPSKKKRIGNFFFKCVDNSFGMIFVLCFVR